MTTRTLQSLKIKRSTLRFIAAFITSCRRYCYSVHVRGDIRRRIPDVIQKTTPLHVHQTGWGRQPLVHSVTWPGVRSGVRQSPNCRVSKGVR